MLKKKLRDLKEDVYLANLELYEKGFALYNFGNITGIDRDSGLVAVKPAGVDYIDLTPDSILLVDLSGKVIEGNYNHPADIRTHLELYRGFSEIGGIAHVHSIYASAWAQAVKPIPCFGSTHADYFPGEIPCTEVLKSGDSSENYEERVGKNIVALFNNRKIDPYRIKAVLVGGHGPYVWGKDPDEAVLLSLVLERIAQISYITTRLNPSIGEIDPGLSDMYYNSKIEEAKKLGYRESVLRIRRKMKREERRERKKDKKD